MHIGNPPMLPSTSTGAAIMTFLQNAVIITLTYRAMSVCANKQLLQEEENYIRKSTHMCKYPTLALNRLEPTTTTYNRLTTVTTQNMNIYMVVLYTKGLSERFKNICGSIGAQVHFKGHNTIRNVLVVPKTGIRSFRKVG